MKKLVQAMAVVMVAAAATTAMAGRPAAAPAAAQVPDFTLDTIRVQVGSRASPALPVATRAVQVITAEDIASSPARTVAEVLTAALGLDVLSRSPAQTDVSLRDLLTCRARRV